MELRLDLNKRYTFADYLQWADNKRRELFNGFIKLMTPAPNLYHQRISMSLLSKFILFYDNNKPGCQLFHAPFDVRLPNNGEKSDDKIYTVVQPDIVIICDKDKLDEHGCIGAPDFIIEIISPSTAERDMHEKKDLYEKHGVKEYWIVFPNEEIIQAYFLKKNKYQSTGVYTKGQEIPVQVFKGKLAINTNEIFVK
jgi:Uma2 family endonuclease